MTLTNARNPMKHSATPTMTRIQKPDVVVTGNKLMETDKAVKFEVIQVDTKILDQAKTEWFPKSQIRGETINPDEMDEDTLHISNWIATTKGYI